MSSFAPSTVRIVPKNPALFGSAALLGLSMAGYTLYQQQKLMADKAIPALEQQFGTADGYFPSAFKGASLSKLPGNHLKIVGQHYPPVSERRTYATKRYTKFTNYEDNCV